MKIRLKVIGLLATLLFAVFGYSPAMAIEACSCMCVEGEPDWVCVDAGPFVPTAPESCLAMECPSVVVPPVEEDTVDAPADGLVCKKRSVYRPDLGRYKRHKVCKPALSDEQLAARDERREMWRQKVEEAQANWDDKKTRSHRRYGRKHHRRHHDDDRKHHGRHHDNHSDD